MTVLETLSRGWEPAPVPAVGLAALVVAYLLAARRVARTCPARPWPRARTAWFLGGTVVLAVAIMGPPGYYDDTFFFAHMTQHVLLMLVGVPLLVLGDPLLLSLRTASRPVRRRWLVPAYRSRVVRGLCHPAVGWTVLSAVTVLSHVPAVYDYPLTHPAVHDYLEHPVLVGSALLFFYPLLSPTAGPWQVRGGVRLLSLATIMVPAAFTGFFIYAAPHVAYPFYAHVSRPFGPGPLADQQLAGALMWSTSMVLSVGWLCVGGLHWLHDEASRTRRLDRAIALEDALAPPDLGDPGWPR